MSLGSLIGPAVSLVGGFLSKKTGEKEGGAIRAGSAEAAAKFDPFLGTGAGANEAIAGALGLGGAPGQDQAFQNFLGSTGFKAQLAAGSEAITGNQAAQGLLNSGATLKRLTTFGQDLAQGGFQNFLANLGGLANRGLTAAGGSAAALTGANVPAAAADRRGGEGFLSGLGDAAQGFVNAFGQVKNNPSVVGGFDPRGR